jgi:hypothetical protein
MAAKKKSWREKLADSKDLPKVVNVAPPHRKRWGGATLAIPAPRDIDALMRQVPAGKVTTINELRVAIAKRHRAAAACPITTGVFSWIAAHAAEEAVADGEAATMPYWRTLKSGGELNPKYPGGLEAASARLAAEGHTIVRKGNRAYVGNLAGALFAPRAR